MKTDRLGAARKGLHIVIRGVTWVAGAALIIMTLATAINVVARYIFRQPIPGAIEIGSLLLVVIVFFAIAYTEVNNQHIMFREVTDRFPRRQRSIVMSVMYFIAAVFFIVMGWRSVVLAIEFIVPITRNTDVIHIPIYPVIFIMAIGAVLLGLELLLNCFSPLTVDGEDNKGEVQ